MRCSSGAPPALAAVAAFLLLACVSAGCKRAVEAGGAAAADAGVTKPAGTGAAEPAEDGDPSILVVVHSFTGRTARAGEEIARMLGGRLRIAGDPPGARAGGGAPMEDALAVLRGGGIRRVYLGFPIWNEAPSPAAEEFVRTAPLSGVTVVPFYTYLHYVEPASLERLAEAIRARGGAPLAPLALLVPLSFTEAQVRCLARRSLLARPEAWPWTREAPPVARCAAAPSTGILCSVPAGWAWVGDTSGDCLAEPPRATRVEAFELQQVEVTIAAYERCSARGECPEAALHDGFTARLAADGDGSLPVPGVSHAGATAHCAALGMRLPTEAEWIRAGRADGTASYPWGPTWSDRPPRGNFGERPGIGYPHYSLAAEGRPSDGFKGLAPGCRFRTDRSAFGVCDLAGNLSEWVTPADDRRRDRRDTVLMGGNWLLADPAALRLSSRASIPASLGGFYLSGFRCARSVARR